MAEQAAAILRKRLDLSSRHAAKAEAGVRGSRSTGKIHGLRTFDKYVACLKQAGEWLRQARGLRRLDEMSRELAQAYLEFRADVVGQKQLDADRNALELLVGDLPRVREIGGARSLPSRAYTREQVASVALAQDERNKLSTRIAYEAGLRGHELFTLRRAEEDRPSAHRHWRAERFEGRDGVRYVVVGKGGLKREILLSEATAQRLEERRLERPREAVDRGIRYAQLYDINGGNRWSASFGAASKRALGWSAGAHGLRHAYAQERMRELVDEGRFGYAEAREIVSQELGHFRGEIVETYLR